MRRRTPPIVVLALAAALAAAPAGDARVNANVAALQVALRARALYAGDVDGIRGPATAAAVRRFQRRVGLPADGIAGRRTRAALGRHGRPRLGSRVIAHGATGWDVAALQFLLARHGFPSGTIDGGFGPRTAAALRRYQRWARIAVDGVAGSGTLASLRSNPPRSPLRFSRPVAAPVGDRFGPRGARFHSGVDFTAWYGDRVVAARAGRVVFAGWDAGGYGLLVSIAHGRGVRTLYAHLSRIDVRPGQRVSGGYRIGRVGSTGHSTGPHLHFEVRVRGAAVNPLPALR
jgi:murein DD-endopeptidase MepM/ murein hydrolase activator NlpD